MKTRKSNEAAAAPQAKGKVKLKNLKLTKETLQDLSPKNAGAVKGAGGGKGGTVTAVTC